MEPTLGHGKICYLEISATDVEKSSTFYEKTFSWKLRRRGNREISFDDGVGQVSGMWVLGVPPLAVPGIVISIMVDDAEATVKAIVTNGGEIVQPIGAHFPEITARFKDPGGISWGSTRSGRIPVTFTHGG